MTKKKVIVVVKDLNTGEKLGKMTLEEAVKLEKEK